MFDRQRRKMRHLKNTGQIFHFLKIGVGGVVLIFFLVIGADIHIKKSANAQQIITQTGKDKPSIATPITAGQPQSSSIGQQNPQKSPPSPLVDDEESGAVAIQLPSSKSDSGSDENLQQDTTTQTVQVTTQPPARVHNVDIRCFWDADKRGPQYGPDIDCVSYQDGTTSDYRNKGKKVFLESGGHIKTLKSYHARKKVHSERISAEGTSFRADLSNILIKRDDPSTRHPVNVRLMGHINGLPINIKMAILAPIRIGYDKLLLLANQTAMTQQRTPILFSQ